MKYKVKSIVLSFFLLILLINFVLLYSNYKNEQLIESYIFKQEKIKSEKSEFNLYEINYLETENKPTLVFFVSLLTVQDIVNFWDIINFYDDFYNEVNFYFFYSCTEERKQNFIKSYQHLNIKMIRDENDTVYKQCNGSSILFDSNGFAIQRFYMYSDSIYLNIRKIVGKEYQGINKKNKMNIEIGSDLRDLIIIDDYTNRIDIANRLIFFTSMYDSSRDIFYHPEFLTKIKKNDNILYIFEDISDQNIKSLNDSNIEFGYIVRNENFIISTPSAYRISVDNKVNDEIDYRSFY